MQPALIQTKIQQPYFHEKLVQRPHLVHYLNQNSGRKLTLISAPAGYGKTTLVTTWLNQCGFDFCWVSLDENDNDPMQFWSYVIAALQTVFPGMGDDFLSALRSSPTTAVPALINNIADSHLPSEPCLLVLDDYHVIHEPAIHDGLVFLLTHMPPGLHVVITSRADPPFPLPRWRVRGQVTEIRDGDLRFSELETAVFFNQIMNLNLSEADVAALEIRTEGWVASLKLAALAMQTPAFQAQDRHDFVTTFTGSDRYLVDYLLEEVLQHQPPHIQEFLLETAVLDRLCASLCDAILTDNTHASTSVLAYLEQANLFLTPLDNQRQWYRYHHLFADLLRYRLQEIHPERTAVLHQKAANWFKQQGLREEAVTHALASEDYDTAIRFITQFDHDLFAEGKMMVLRNWVNKLPEAFIYQRQKLFLLQAWLLLRTGQFRATITHLQSPLPEDEPVDQTTQVEYTYLQGASAYYQGDWQRGLMLGKQALTHASPQNVALYLPVLSLLAWCYDMLGQPDKAIAQHQQVLQISEPAHILTATVASLGMLAQLYAEKGELKKSQRCFKEACQIAIGRNQPQLPILGVAYIGQGMVAQRKQQWETAVFHLQEGIDLCRRWGGLIVVTLKGYHLLAQVYQAMGEQKRAQETQMALSDCIQQTHVPAELAAHFVKKTPQTAPSPLTEPLTNRENEILSLLVNGRSAPQIADELVIGVSTVRTHIKRIYGKLGAHSRHEAIAKARALGHIPQ